MEALIATAGNLRKCIACTFEGLDCRGGFENQIHQAASSSRLVHEPLRFLSLSNRAISSCNGGFGSTTWCTWHSTGLSPGSVEVFPALHSSFLFLPSSFQQEACVYVWLSLVLSCCPFSGLVRWLCQLPFLFPGVPSMSNTPESNFKLGGNLTEWHSTGLSPGSVPSLAFLLSISSIFFSARSMCVCLVVIEFVMLSIFWAGWVVVSAAFFVSRGSEHVEYPENNFKLGGNLTEWHSTGLFSGSVPSLSFFLSISSIFFSARSMCLCLVVTGFVMFCAFSGLVGWLCQLPFLFPGVPSMSNTPESNFKLGGNLTEWHSTGLSPGSVPSLAFFLSISSTFFSARSMCLCLVVSCHWFCHVLCIFWAGWVVVSAAFFVSRGSEHVEYPQNNFTLGGNLTEWHSTGLSPGSVPSLGILPFYFFHFLLARSMCVCLVVTGFVMLSIFWAG